MKRIELMQKVAVFPADGAEHVVIDDLKICLSPVNLAARRASAVISRRGIRTTADLGLACAADVTTERRPDGVVWEWHHDGATCQQRVGGGGVSQTLDLNPLRAVRHALSPAEADRHAGFPTHPDNWVRPDVVPGDEVRRRQLAWLAERLDAAACDYTGLLGHVFGLAAAPETHRRSVNVIELAWDFPCGLASVAHHGYWPAWKQVLDGTLGANGVLKASRTRRENYKLYAKTDRLLRFEVQLSGRRAADVLGRTLSLADVEAFARGVRALADEFYPRILEIQRALWVTDLPPLVDLLLAAYPPRLLPVARRVWAELLATGRVKRESQRDYRLLRQMRERGWVRVGPGRGWWSATPEFDAGFRAIHRFINASGRRLAS